MQKTFCAEFLTKKLKKNEGEPAQYYTRNRTDYFVYLTQIQSLYFLCFRYLGTLFRAYHYVMIILVDAPRPLLSQSPVQQYKYECLHERKYISMGTTRNDSAILCPKCQRRVKSNQINRVREDRQVEEATGLTRRYISNLINGVLTARNTSGVRGVYWHEGHKRWVATGRQDGKVVTLGEFEDISEATEVRQRHVLKTYAMAALSLGIEV